MTSVGKMDLIIEAMGQEVDIGSYLFDHQIRPAFEFYEEGAVDLLDPN